MGGWVDDEDLRLPPRVVELAGLTAWHPLRRPGLTGARGGEGGRWVWIGG